MGQQEVLISHDQYISCINELKKLSSPEVHSDDLSLGIYATDASLYQVKPLVVVLPKTEKDVIDVVSIAHSFKVPVLPRGSATSLAGQTTNGGIIIDFTKYLNSIISLDPLQKTATVQPGVVRDQLNAAVKKFNLHFAPDPATTSRATIGGMIANNSSGTKSIRYGKTIDHVVGMKVLLMNGTILEVSSMDQSSWDQKTKMNNEEGYIYRRLRALIFENAEEIDRIYPKVLRSVQGYALDYFVRNDDWNLSWLFCGSEGSLGLILEATVNLEPIPKYKAAVALHYNDRITSIEEVIKMVEFKPAAVEMLDFHVFEKSKIHPLTREIHANIIQGEPQSVMTVEFLSEFEEDLNQQLSSFLDWVKSESKAYAYPVYNTDQRLDQVWSLRKNGLGLIMGDPGGRKPIPFIEDMAIPLENLAEYISEILQLCEKFGVETILYAHASVGVLHVRPSLDMMKSSDINLMKKISEEVFILVKKYKGAWSGEHGDGRNRGHRLPEFFGPTLYKCLQEIKHLLDPEQLLNPGIIIGVPPMDRHLRYGPDYQENDETFIYQYRNDHSFSALVHNCSGVGACRNKTGGTMCPSFRATSEEKDSTRGRANALRLAMSNQLSFSSLSDKKVLNVLDLCLSCKACKSECPSNVDMAKLKSEVLQKKYEKEGMTIRERFILNHEKLAKLFSGRLSLIINRVQEMYIFRKSLEKFGGIHSERILPKYSGETLESWYISRQKTKAGNKEVALFNDCYLNYHEEKLGKLAIQLLEQCGFEVTLVSAGCCQRPKISNGFLRKAKSLGEQTARILDIYLDKKIPVVVCEPSCTSALTEDLPDLLEDSKLGLRLKNGVFTIDGFLAEAWKSGTIKGKWLSKEKEVLLHGHCHQKATVGTDAMHSILASIQGLKFSEPDTGCCGMAGSFGYEKEHYQISKIIAENMLIPAIEQSGSSTQIIANGFSCRHQIHDFSGKKAKHWLEILEFQPEGD